MLTGLYPPEHGLITNGRGRLDASIPLLAETLKQSGYETAAFIASFVLHAKFGLNRGFDTYDDDLTNTDPTEQVLHRQRDGQRVVDRALAWLEKPRGEPFFCWVHLYDAHHPYQPHADRFGEQFRERPYDGEIAYVDLQVQRLRDYLKHHNLTQRTLIIVVGDHGESLGEHDENEHSLTLYDAALRVPWIWSGPGVAVAGRRVSQTVSLIDLSPTLLETLGLRQLGRCSGRSLGAALQGREFDGSDCYGATDDPLLGLGCAPVRSLATAEWKYIRTTEPELYNLGTDPHELQNLATSQPEQTQQMEARLAKLERQMTRRSGDEVQISAQEKRVLESLGYLGGGRSPDISRVPGEPLPDIKRILPLFNAVDAIQHQILEGHGIQAETAARELVARSPDFTEGQLVLGESLLLQSKYDECRELLEQILARNPDNSKAHFQRGMLESAQGHGAAAVGHFRKALQLKTETATLYNLAMTLMHLRQAGEAQGYFEEALDIDPTHVKAHIGLALLLTQNQRIEDALEHYRLALAYDEGSVEAHTNLAVLAIRQDHQEEALVHLARAAKLAPDNAETRANFGIYLLSCNRLNDAIAELTEAVLLQPNHPQAAKLLQEAKAMKARSK